MSVSNCLEISSMYRDRFLYPNPSEFTVKLSESGCDSNNFINPISLSYPIYNFQGPSGEDWTNNIIDNSGASLSGVYTREPTGAGTISMPNVDASNNSVIHGNNVSTETGYYNGLYFIDVSGTLTNPIGLTSSSIYNYTGLSTSKFLNNDEINNIVSTSFKNDTIGPPLSKVDYNSGESCSVVLESHLSDKKWRNGNTTWAINYNNINSISDGSRGYITVHGAKPIDGLYVNHYLEDVSLPIAKVGSDFNGFSGMNERFKKIVKHSGYNRKINVDVTDGAFPLSTTNDPSGAWLACDKYRIREKKPLVMGWGIDEPYPLGPNRGVTASNCSGTGPTCGQNGAVYNIRIIDEGTGYIIGKYPVTSDIGDSLYVEITNIGYNNKKHQGAVKDIKIIFPGRNFVNGTKCTINGGDDNCVIEIIDVGQSIDISNGLNSNKVTSGVLSNTYNQYKGDIVYLSSRSLEHTGSVLYKKPSYYKQLPPTLSKNLNSKNKYKEQPYTSDLTGSDKILGYFTYNNRVLYDNSLMTLPTNWGGDNISQTPADNGAIIVIKGFEEYGVVGGSLNGSGNSNNGWYDTSGNVNWEIQKCDYDGVNDLIYYGSKTSQDQSVLYNITLVSLVLPNTTLLTGIGGRISAHPFLYVEFTNISSQGNKQIISSNNPNSINVLFKVPIKDISNPDATNFIKLDGAGITHKIKFKPNDDLKIRIFFEDGDLFTTSLSDNAPPLKPNPLAQLSAIFNIQRI